MRLGCAALRRQLDLVRKNARLGEVGALRAFVVASGKAPDDFIRMQRSRNAGVEQAREATLRERTASAAAAGAASAALR